MKYIVWLGIVVACALSTLAGVTIGINMNPASTTRYVIAWGSVGDWVSGAGALSAVAVALWQAHSHRKDDVEDLVIEQAMHGRRWVISVVSKGKRPARITGAGFYSPKIDTVLPIKRFVFEGHNAGLPQTLNYAEDLHFVTASDMFETLAANAVKNFDDLEDLEILVKTTLGSFKVAVKDETKVALRAVLNES